MKKFKFTLQTLLNVTVALEKEQKNKLALINRQLDELKDIRQGYYDGIEETKELYTQSLTRKRLSKSMLIFPLRNMKRWRHRMNWLKQ